ncbi:MAG: protein kinase [Verrucomicrobia bacterium]|nr:protein kinase [Verrucomicrobiota bacterium]
MSISIHDVSTRDSLSNLFYSAVRDGYLTTFNYEKLKLALQRGIEENDIKSLLKNRKLLKLNFDSRDRHFTTISSSYQSLTATRKCALRVLSSFSNTEFGRYEKFLELKPKMQSLLEQYNAAIASHNIQEKDLKRMRADARIAIAYQYSKIRNHTHEGIIITRAKSYQEKERWLLGTGKALVEIDHSFSPIEQGGAKKGYHAYRIHQNGREATPTFFFMEPIANDTSLDEANMSHAIPAEYSTQALCAFRRRGEELFVLYPNRAKGDLSKNRLQDQEVLQATKHLLEGAVALQNANIVHGDIKPKNIFVDSDNRCTYGDWGTAKSSENSDINGGTIYFMAPESYSDEHPGYFVSTHKSDMWSLGATLCDTYFHTTPSNYRTPFFQQHRKDEYNPSKVDIDAYFSNLFSSPMSEEFHDYHLVKEDDTDSLSTSSVDSVQIGNEWATGYSPQEYDDAVKENDTDSLSTSSVGNKQFSHDSLQEDVNAYLDTLSKDETDNDQNYCKFLKALLNVNPDERADAKTALALFNKLFPDV